MQCVIPGKPVGAARPRLGKGRRVYSPASNRAWLAKAVSIIRAAMPQARRKLPCRVVLHAFYPRPKRLVPRSMGGTQTLADTALEDSGDLVPRPTVKPDIDNVAKLALDALTKAGVIADDTYVVELEAYKDYADPGGSGHVGIELEWIA